MNRREVLFAGLVGSIAATTACGATMPPPRRVSIRDFGASGTGSGDDTYAFQRAADSLTGGGTIDVPAGRYTISAVAITNRNIRIAFAPGAMIARIGAMSIARRAIFIVDGLRDAGVEIVGGDFDLRGAGPGLIGQANVRPNRYASLTIPSIIGIAGPPNALLFARRSSGLAVRGCRVVNSGENALLFRNCGNIEVSDCQFENIANYGVEFSFVAGQADGGEGPVPARDNCLVARCTFANIDDYALGSGNGAGIGGGGGPGMGAFNGYRIVDCTFQRCQRDIHFEFQGGSWIDGMEITRVRSREARQGSIGLVAVVNAVLSDIEIVNPGSAPSSLLIPARPEIYGIVLSSGFARVQLRDVSIVDDRPGRQIAAVGAVGSEGSTRLRIARDVFVPGDREGWIGVARGNPQQCAYVARIAEVVSPRECTLSLPLGASVSRAGFAFGGLTRNGIVLTAGKDVAFDNVVLRAGSAGDEMGQSDASAIRMQGMSGEISFRNTALTAPGNALRHPAAIRTRDNGARIRGLENVRRTGFERDMWAD